MPGFNPKFKHFHFKYCHTERVTSLSKLNSTLEKFRQENSMAEDSSGQRDC